MSWIFGGGSTSKNTSNIITKSAVSALTENIMQCSSNNYMVQEFKIKGSYQAITNFKQVQAINISADCTQIAQNLSSIQQKVSTALQQAAESQSVSVLGALGNSRAEVNSTIENDVRQSITVRNIQKTINSSMAEQRVTIEGDHNIIDKFEQSQTATIVWSNAQKLINSMKSVQDITNAATQASKATQTNFIAEIFDSFFGGLAQIWLVWMILFIAIIYFAVSFVDPTALFLSGDDNPYVVSDMDYNYTQNANPYPQEPQMGFGTQYVEQYAG